MERYYQIAGVEIAVQIPHQLAYQEDHKLEAFRVSQVADPHRFVFQWVEKLTPPQGTCAVALPDRLIYAGSDAQVCYIGGELTQWDRAALRVLHRGKEHLVQCRQAVFTGGISGKTVLDAMQAEHLLAQNNAFLLHASCIEWKGKAILFTAPSGTGKSTQATLWQQLRGAQIVNGDRIAVRWDGSQFYAQGVPFSGSSGICENVTLPLAAVVYLTQAPQTRIQPLRGVASFRKIWEGISLNVWDTSDVENVSASVQRLVQTLPVYNLSCTPDESAIVALENVLESRCVHGE